MTATMLMPEAPVYVDNLVQSRENNIGPSRQIPSIKPETVSKSMNQPPDEQFRLGVSGFYRRHNS